MNHRQKLVQQQFLNNEEEILTRLKRSYGQAQHDVNAKIKTLQLDIDGLEKLWEDFDGTEEEAEILRSRIQSKIYQKKYQEAIKGQVDGILNDLRRNAYENISEYLEKCYDDGFIGTMFDLQGQGIPMIMPIDQEAVVRAVQLDSKISKGLYTRMGEEVETLKKTITNEVTRGIVNGMSYAQVAQQIKFKMTGTYDTPGGAMYRAQTIARTEGHRIQTAAAMDACYKAKEKGADVVKQWDATLDDATRESHVKCDGEIRELDKPFSNGLMFPGDPAGGPGEVVNCRCALLQRARWALADGFTKYDNFSGEHKEFDSPEAYTDFKNAYFSKENRAYMSYVKDLEGKYKTKDFNNLLDLMDDDEYARFVKLQDARPMFPGVYRGDNVIKAGGKSQDLTIPKNDDKMYPEKLAGVKRGKPMTFEEADTGKTNPNYGKEHGYSINCQSCVVANEARRRGYDVYTLPNTNNPTAKELSRYTNLAWLDPDTGKAPEYITDQSKTYTPKSYQKYLEGIVEKGKRYTLQFGWKGRGNSGHIVNLDRTEGGILRIKDNQRGPSEKSEWIGDEEILQYLSRLRYSRTFYGEKYSTTPKVLRVDNLQFNLDVVEKIMKGAK